MNMIIFLAHSAQHRLPLMSGLLEDMGQKKKEKAPNLHLKHNPDWYLP